MHYKSIQKKYQTLRYNTLYMNPVSKVHMKRSIPSVVIGAIAIASTLASEENSIVDFANAGESKESTNLFEIAAADSQKKAIESEEQKTQKSKRSPYPSQSSTGKMFDSAQPPFRDHWDVCVSGDWLFWKACEEGLEYGLQTKDPGSDETKSVRGSLSKITPSYHSGYRIGFDFTFPHDAWNILIQWTRYQNKHKEHPSFKRSKIFWPNFLNENGSPSAREAFAKWDLSYSVLDLELGRAFFVAKHLSIRPFISFEAAWIKQKLKVRYEGIDFNQVAAEPDIISNQFNKNNGYGLRAGLDTKWPIEWGVSLFGDFAFSLLYTEFKLSQFEKNADSTPRSHVKDRLHFATRTVQMAGGIQWERLFYKDRLFFSVYATWEQQVWFDQNQLNIFLNGSGTALGETWNQQGNLTLSGVTLGATFGF